MTNRRKQFRLVLTAALAALATAVLAACETDPIDPGQPGNLAVLVSGLPSGASGQVSVSGPDGFSDTIAASETFAGLPPGSYFVTAATVEHEGIEYQASVSGSPAAVSTGALATVTVIYQAASTAPGSLTVIVSGLPAGVDGEFTVLGPNGFDESRSTTTTFSSVEPGVYTVTAETATDGDDEYAATISGSPATVTAGGSATVTVTYAYLDPGVVGSLQVDITGLPSGTAANVNVSGPSGFDQNLTASATLSNLTPAYYDVTAGSVSAGGLSYTPVVTTSPTLVLPDATATVAVSYQPTAPNDGDSASNPGLFVQFRVTAGNPLWVEGLPFNSTSRLDVKGIQLRDELGTPADPGDFIDIRLVHGQSNTTTIRVTLECGSTASPSPIRADLRDTSGAKIGLSTLCNTTRNIAVPNTGVTGQYVMHIVPVFNEPYYTDYVLSINAYCGATCNFVPHQP